jgi:hypothetical protein
MKGVNNLLIKVLEIVSIMWDYGNFLIDTFFFFKVRIIHSV